MDSGHQKSCPTFHHSRPTRNWPKIITRTGRNRGSGSRRRVGFLSGLLGFGSSWVRRVLWLHRKIGLRSSLLRASSDFTLNSGLSLSLYMSLFHSLPLELSLSLGFLSSPLCFNEKEEKKEDQKEEKREEEIGRE